MARKKKNLPNRWGMLFLLSLLISIMLLGYDRWINSKNRMVAYDAFGILIPENFFIHGIDVSRYQQKINWDTVKEMKVKNIKLGFAYIKATQGSSNEDPQFRRNWRKARQAGIIRGAYHFFIASQNGQQQAEHFIETVGSLSSDLPPAVDIEQLNDTPLPVLKKELKKWLDVVEKFYKTKPVIYTSVDFYTQYLAGDFDAYPLWVAHYFQEKQPRITRPWIFWQHSEEGRVNGILSKVDFNVFYGDSTEFKNLLVR